MEHKGKTFVSVLIIISFFFSFIFCFDSPNIFTNIMLIGADILFWGRTALAIMVGRRQKQLFKLSVNLKSCRSDRVLLILPDKTTAAK